MPTTPGSRDDGRSDQHAEGDAGDHATLMPSLFPSLPRQIGDYQILREVGRGGMGVVYEAEQISLGRRVALKVLPGHVLADRKAQERFRHEAKAAARLHHTNIVPVFEVGRDGEVAFYAMQFIQGQGLDRVIDELARLRGPVPDPTGVDQEDARPGTPLLPVTTLAVASAAAALPKQRLELVAASLLSGRLGTEGLLSSASADPAFLEAALTERLDPALVTEPELRTAGQPMLEALPRADVTNSAVLPGGRPVSEADSTVDRKPYFRSVAQIGRQAAQGLAYAHARGVIHRDIKPSNLLLDTSGVVWITDFGLAKADDDELTATGDILGTLRYIAPERLEGAGDARADIYALGLTLYELLTLRPAFRSTDRIRLIERIKAEEPLRPRSLDSRIPRDLETIVLKAIDKDPKARYESAEALDEDLGRFLADEPIQARQVGAAERYWRWARRNPVIAVLGGVLTGVLLLITLTSLIAARKFQNQAEILRDLAAAQGTERRVADRAREKEAAARLKADQANASLRATQETLNWTVYATRSELGLAAWDTNDVGHLLRLLRLMRPRSDETDRRGWEWRYLWQLGHEDRLTIRTGPKEKFTRVAFSPDGQVLATLERSGRIQLRDRRTGAVLQTTGVTSGGRPADLGRGVVALAFSPDGRMLAGPGPDASLVLYSVETSQPVIRLESTKGAILDVAWSPDGKTLVGGFSTHLMRVWDARDGHLIQGMFGRHAGPVASVAFSPDGLTLASASLDRTVKLWKLDDPVNPRAILRGHTDEVRAVAFSADGRHVASAGFDRTIRLWDARSGAELAVIRGHVGPVMTLAYLPDSERVVTGSADQTIRLWDTVSRLELRSFKGTDAVSSLAVSRGGRDIASASDETVRIWSADTPPRPQTLQSPSVLPYGGAVECLAFSADGHHLASGHSDNVLRVWDLRSGQPPRLFKGHSHIVQCAAFSPDGRSIASGGMDRTVRIWDSASGQSRLTFKGHDGELKAVLFTPDGQTVVSGGSDRTIRAWDPATGALRYRLEGHTGTVNDLAFSPDGQTLASAGYDRSCILWDLPGRKRRLVLTGHAGSINGVAFSADGHTLATASSDCTVRLWDPVSGVMRGILIGHTEDVDGLAFSLDGRLASSGWDQTIRIWDPASEQNLLVMRGHTARIRRIKFSPDGRTLASASYDRTIKLWEAAPASVLTTRN
jgi:WD40 repeat protein